MQRFIISNETTHRSLNLPPPLCTQFYKFVHALKTRKYMIKTNKRRNNSREIRSICSNRDTKEKRPIKSQFKFLTFHVYAAIFLGSSSSQPRARPKQKQTNKNSIFEKKFREHLHHTCSLRPILRSKLGGILERARSNKSQLHPQ